MIHSQKNLNTEGDIGFVFPVFLFLFIPLAYLGFLFDPTQIPHLAVGFVSIISFCVYLLFKKRAFIYSVRWADIAWLAYIGLSLQGIFHCTDISIAIFEFSKIVFSFFLFFLFRIEENYKRMFLSSSFACSIVCVFQFIILFCQKKTGLDIYGSHSDFYGTMTHANVLSESILVAFPLICYGLFVGPNRYKPISLLGLASCLILLITLKTRAVWVSFAIACLLIFRLLLFTNSFKQLFAWLARRKKFVVPITVGVLVVGVFFISQDFTDIKKHLHDLVKLDSSGRFEIWKRTVPIIQHHFWFGTGLGNWRFYIPPLRGEFNERPHNDLLWIFSETGIFGLLAFCTICVIAVKKMLSNIRSLQNDKLLINYCALFGFVAYLVDSCFAFPKERPYNLVFFSLFTAIPFVTAATKNILSISLKKVIPFIGIISVGLLVFCCIRLDGERKCKIAITKTDLSLQERIRLFQSIKTWVYMVDPFTTPLKQYEGLAWLENGDLQKAKECFIEAYKIYPYQPNNLLNLGTACELTGERENARRYYRDAIAADARDARPKINLAVIEYKDGAFSKSAELIKTINPDSIKNDSQSIVQLNILRNSLRSYLQK